LAPTRTRRASTQLISPLRAVLGSAPTNDAQGSARVQGLALLPLLATHVRTLWAWAGASDKNGTSAVPHAVKARISLVMTISLREARRRARHERRVHFTAIRYSPQWSALTQRSLVPTAPRVVPNGD
jgi:hypothetical protein